MIREYSRTELEYLIREYVVGKNAERDRDVMRRRLIDGIIFERLAEEFDLSTTQVKRIVDRRKKQIFRKRN